MLLAKHANINIQDVEGYTPFEIVKFVTIKEFDIGLKEVALTLYLFLKADKKILFRYRRVFVVLIIFIWHTMVEFG
jgi:hypothetical protein